MGGNSLIINSSPSETRVALLENGQPVEVYIERHQSAGLVGNIYRGRVVRVLPGTVPVHRHVAPYSLAQAAVVCGDCNLDPATSG